MSDPPRDTRVEDRTAVEALDAVVKRPALGAWIARQRWSGAKGRAVVTSGAWDAVVLDDAPPAVVLARIATDVDDAPVSYAVVAAVGEGGEGAIDDGIADATDDARVPRALIGLIGAGAIRATLQGAAVRATTTRVFRELLGEGGGVGASVRRVAGEQSNTSWVVGERVVIKLLRRLHAGVHPDAEVTGFLTDAGFAHAPRFVGSLTHGRRNGSDPGTVLVVAQEFVPSRGDAWKTTLADLSRVLDGELDVAQSVAPLERLGEIVAELHATLATGAPDSAFEPQPASERDRRSLLDSIEARARAVADATPRAATDERGALEALATRAAGARGALEAATAALDAPVHTIRTHGDLHLGQVLATAEGEFVVIDYEGEPSRPMDQRRMPDCALRDVAGMLRSFGYAAAVARRGGSSVTAAVMTATWERAAREAFLRGYARAIGRAPVALVPPAGPAFDALLALFELDKALYEVRYEVDHRPDHVAIPLEGAQRALATLGVPG